MPENGCAGVVRPPVRGVGLDAQTRCVHYRSVRDIVAIRMKCCGVYYACKECHEALADHVLQPWPGSEWDRKAVLCGACGTEMSIRRYLESESVCPACSAPFNPGCTLHHQAYFAMSSQG